MRAATQFKKGALEMCVLYLLKNEDRYGYDLTQVVNKYVPTTEGALYPVLRRLVKEDFCISYTKESSGGPSRKYYRITSKGEDYLASLIEDWDIFVQNIKKMREDEDNGLNKRVF
ncbi:PadR family transcriptional regulator [Carnobacterium divergens]|uniref:Transcription regulator PadR N-terminal domain-containing protein n=2 Tax=Carnobacterium divergens TaxID=2748 RepID=A0A0R2HWN7_CARDV|nr:PadR family transcriptional regulator [Carnobacterium divergens]AOA00374.1 PadR family transcriptional regulator [Carnobacterium divergens]KRN54764.1 hypothetical protein IV74_GL002351 [Carnobacterium divergens DSM 20623]MCO6017269.1 PadR family transcriptional regulator [Carnobacterium divergens]MDO0874251.1 PadR family transcriptional regulator [Carnobacterium divergens]MDT1939316.1 PadR family transcriptional regulator [Carnobacterium divergens]